MNALMRRLSFGLLLLCLVVPARAQDEKPPPITMNIASPLMISEKPFLLHRRQGRWFPIAVTLTNSGDPVKGRLTLRLTSGSGFDRPTSQFTTDIELPQTARKRIWIYGRIEREETDGLEVSFSGRGFRGLLVKGGVAPAEPGRRTLLTISDSGERLGFLSTTTGKGLTLNEETRGLDENSKEQLDANPVRALGAPHELVPDRWIGLDAVDDLMLADFPHNALSEEQLAALRGFVAAGGTLVVPGGSDWQRLAQSPLKDLWPLLPRSSSPAPASQVAFLAREYVSKRVLTPGDRLGGAPVLAQRGTIQKGAEVVVEKDGAPLIVKARNGAGLVVWTAFDPSQPPFAGWDGQAKLWAQIFQQGVAPPRVQDAAIEFVGANYNPGGGYNPNYGTVQNGPQLPTAVLRNALAAAPQLRTPPVSYIVWFLALYVFFLVPVNYAVLRYFDKREWAWITIPIIVLGFSGLSYAAALKIKGNAILTRQINIVQGSAGSGLARADAMLWLFSPRRTTYDIVSKEAHSAVGDYVGGEEDPGVVISQPDPRASMLVKDAPIKMWDWKTFVGHSVVGSGRGVALAKDKSLQNNTPFALRGAVLVDGDTIRSFGDIAAGATARAVPGRSSVSGPQRLGEIGRLSGAQQLFPTTNYGGSAQIVNALLSLALDQGRQADGKYLVAWSDQLPAALDIGENSPRAQQITLFVFRM